MAFSSQANVLPNPPPVTRQVEKWSEMVEQVERSFDYMLKWHEEEYYIINHKLGEVHMYGWQYLNHIEAFNDEALSEAARLKAVAIRNNPKETPARRRAAAWSLYDLKNSEKCMLEAEVRLRKEILLWIYTQRKLEMRRSLEYY